MIKRITTKDAIRAINPEAKAIVHTPTEGAETIEWAEGTNEI